MTNNLELIKGIGDLKKTLGLENANLIPDLIKALGDLQQALGFSDKDFQLAMMNLLIYVELENRKKARTWLSCLGF